MMNKPPHHKNCNKENCRICHLYATDDRYRKLFDTKIVPEKHVVISLRRRADRRLHIHEQFEKARQPYELFDAIDGKKMPLPLNWKAGSGAYGCNQSHTSVLRQAVIDDVQSIAIYEDDVVLCDDYKAKLDELLAKLPDDWDAVMLGGQTRKQPLLGKDGYRRTQSTHRTHAYIVRGQYIKTLLHLWTSEQGHVDHVWGRHQHEANIYQPDIWLCGQGKFRSNISGKNDDERWWQKPVKDSLVRDAAKKKPCSKCGKRKAQANAQLTQQERMAKIAKKIGFAR